MLRAITRPEVLFLMGTLMALSPYVVWHFWGTDLRHQFRVTGLPAVIYVIGYVSFLLGTLVVRRPRVVQPFCYSAPGLSSKVFWALVGLTCLTLIQMIGIIKVYGTLPILSLISGQLHINDVNDALMDTELGQMALLRLTLCLLTAAILLSIIQRVETGRSCWTAPSIWVPLAVLAIGTTMTGKRQGLFIAASFIAIGLLCCFGRSVELLIRRLLSRSRLVRLAWCAVGLLIAVLFFDYIDTMRSHRTTTFGGDEVFRNLQLPLINLEYQCELAEYGPDVFAPWQLGRTLLPRRLHLLIPFRAESYERAVRLEPTAPAGFYGELHWHTGIPGMCLGAFLVGLMSKYFYDRAQKSPFYLLSYAQISWALLSCHTYNHFLNLVYIPLPLFVYLGAAMWLRPTKGLSHEGFARTDSIKSSF